MQDLHIRTCREEIVRHTGQHQTGTAGRRTGHAGQDCRSNNSQQIGAHFPGSNALHNIGIGHRARYHCAEAADCGEASNGCNAVIQAAEDLAQIHALEFLEVEQVAAERTQQHRAHGQQCGIADESAADKDKENQQEHRKKCDQRRG